jgi:hypothetical protein
MTMPSPPDDDSGADFEVIKRLDAGEPPRSEEEARTRAPYERLLASVRDLAEIAPPAGWEDRAAARWVATRRRQRIAIAAGTAMAAGLAAAIILVRCGALTAQPALQVAVSTPPGTIVRGEHAVGDVLHVQGRESGAHVELRVYVGARLIVRCPGGEGCGRSGEQVTLDWKLADPGTYEVYLLSSAAEIPPPGGNSVDRDLLAIRSAGVAYETQAITVGQ